MAFKKWLEEAAAQVNVFDQGKTAASVRAARQNPKPVAQTVRKPANTLANNPLTRGASRAFDQANMFDSGRTWKQRTPTVDMSLGQQINQTRRNAGNFVKQAVIQPTVDTTQRTVNTVAAGAVASGSLPQYAAKKIIGDDRGAQNVLDTYGATRDEFLQSGWGGKGSFMTPQQAATRGQGLQGVREAAVKPIAKGTGEIAPYVIPVGAVGQTGKLTTRLVQQGVANAGVSAGSSAANQYANTGRVDTGQVARDAALGGAMGAAAPVLGATTRLVARNAPQVARNTAQVVQQADQRAFGSNPQVAQGGYVGRGDIPDNRPPHQAQIEDALNRGDAQTAKAINDQLPDTDPYKVSNASVIGPVPGSTRKQRGFVTSVKGSTEVSPTAKRQTTGEYDVRSTKQLRERSEQYATGDIAKARADVNTRLDVPEGTIADRDVSDTISVAKRLDVEGDFEGASTLYDKLATHLTKQGQSIQAASLLARRTPEGIQFHAQKQLNKGGVKLTPDKQQQFRALMDNVRKTAPESPERNRAVYDVNQFVSDNIPSGMSDRITNMWRANLLTAPTTTAGNVLGNTGEALTRKLFVNPVAAASDTAMSLFTGKRTQTLAPLGSGLKGAKEGAEKLPEFMRSGYDERNLATDYNRKSVNYGDSKAGKVAKRYVDTVYRMMSVADQPYYFSAHKNALGSLAKAEAINKGLKGAERRQFINEFMDNPPVQAAERAAEEAAFATFNNKTGLGKAAVAAKDGLNKVTPGLGDFIIPFTQVPASIATRVITRTPIGTATEVVRQVISVRKGGSFDQRAMAQAIGEGSFGLVVLGAGAALAKSGNLTFGYPTDKNERKLWEAEGKQPYSIKIGNRWYSMNYIQPFGAIMAVGAKYGEQRNEGDGVWDAATSAVATGGQAITNQSFLKGMSGAIEALNDPEYAASKFVNQSVSSIIPNFVRSLARSLDDTQRETAGDIPGSLKQGIPGLRETTPAKQDMLGSDLPAKDNFANQFLNPFRPSIDRGKNPVVDEVRRLQDADLGVVPSQIKKDSLGKDTELNKDQIRDLQGRVGRSVGGAWNALIGDERYRQLSDEDKSNALKRLSSDVLQAEKQKYAAENQLGEFSPNFNGKKTSLSTGAKAALNGNLNVQNYARAGSGGGSGNTTTLEGDDRGTALLDTLGTMDKTTLGQWEKSDKFDEQYRDLYTRSAGILREGMPPLPENNATLKAYADYLEAKKDAKSELKLNDLKKEFVKKAYTSALPEGSRELFGQYSIDEKIAAIDSGSISNDDLAAAIKLDDIMLTSGLAGTAKISNTIRKAFGFSKAPKVGSSSSRSSSGRKKSGKKSGSDYKLYGMADPISYNSQLRKLVKGATLRG